MPELNVTIPAVEAGQYRIKIGTDILGGLWTEIEADFKDSNFFVVTDENLVSAGHLGKLLAQRAVPTFVISPAGEISKNINTTVAIIEEMERLRFGRDTVIVALGGGTVGDIAGFAAAIFKRGVGVIQIPTTTVAQADSGVGGKTGVDSSVSKNAFGAFWQPKAVYVDVATLITLDDRQFRSGLVESVKHAIVADEQYFEFLEENIEAILKKDLGVLEKIAYLNCKIKAGVVEADPTEKNQRRILNYGHTVGHAVETVSEFGLLHGEAVAIGIVAAGLIEIEMGLSEPARLERIRKLLEKLSVPTALPENMDKEALIEIIKRDKKAINQWPRFVLIDKIGKVHCQGRQWAVEVDQGLVEKVLDKF